MTDIQTKIFSNLQKIGLITPSGDPGFDEYIKLKSSGYMNLNVDFLGQSPFNKVAYMIAMAHNGELNGDLMADPDMEIEIDQTTQMARALSYQNDYMGVYNHVEQDKSKQDDLNSFLLTWTRNIISQGFKV